MIYQVKRLRCNLINSWGYVVAIVYYIENEQSIFVLWNISTGDFDLSTCSPQILFRGIYIHTYNYIYIYIYRYRLYIYIYMFIHDYYFSVSILHIRLIMAVKIIIMMLETSSKLSHSWELQNNKTMDQSEPGISWDKGGRPTLKSMNR